MNLRLTVKYEPLNSPIRSSETRDSFALCRAREPARLVARPSARRRLCPYRLSSSFFHLLYLLLCSLLRIAPSCRGRARLHRPPVGQGITERYNAASEKSASARTSALISSTAQRCFLVDHVAVRLPPTTTRTDGLAFQAGGDLFMCWPRYRINPTPSLNFRDTSITSPDVSTVVSHAAPACWLAASPLPRLWPFSAAGSFCWREVPPRRVLRHNNAVERAAACLVPAPLEGGGVLLLEQAQQSY
jgi:hypothetical protein